LLRRAIAAGRFILWKPHFVAIATATSAIQSQNNHRNPLMFSSNNAGRGKTSPDFLASE